MATFVAFDMTASTSDRLTALIKAAPKPSVVLPAAHLPHLPSMSGKGILAPSVHVKEIAASSGWSVSSAGSTRPSSVMERRPSRGLRGMFTRNRVRSLASQGKPDSILEEEMTPPMPSPKELHRALEFTAMELQEDISVSSATPIVMPRSMNPLICHIDTPLTEEESQRITEAVEKNLAAAIAAESASSDNLGLHAIISKAKRMSITSIQGARPTTATSIMSSPSSPLPSTHAPPTKKRSSIFPRGATRMGSSKSTPKVPEPVIEGHEFFKALKDAKKHSTLSTAKLPSDAIITMSHWKEGEVLALGREKTEKAKQKLKKQISDVINKAGWTAKIYVLTGGSLSSPPYILQFAPTGQASRAAERTLQLTKQSRAFVTDAIPGRHWVLQISELLDILAVDPELKKAGSRMSFRATDKDVKPANLLLVLESGDDMEEWLNALRHEIEVLGGKGKHVEAVAEVPAAMGLEIAMSLGRKPNYPTSALSHDSDLARRDHPTSDSDRGSSSGASHRLSASSSYRPSVDAASSTVSSPEYRNLESLRHSGHSRTDNAPPTPASSTHSPNQSVSSSPATHNTFFYPDTPEETEDDRAAWAGYEYKAMRHQPALPTDLHVLRCNSKAVAERRRSFQIQPSSPLVTELTPPASATSASAAAAQSSKLLQVPEGNLIDLDSADEEERKDTFPTALPVLREEVPKEAELHARPSIPPRSNRRQSLLPTPQTPTQLVLVPSVPTEIHILDAPTPPLPQSRMSRAGTGSGASASGITIQFWGPPPSVTHSRTASQDESDAPPPPPPGLGLGLAAPPPSIQAQIRDLRLSRSGERARASKGRSDPFDLEAVSAPMERGGDGERYSVASTDSMDDGDDGSTDDLAERAMFTRPIQPLTLHDLCSPIGRANAKALARRDGKRDGRRESFAAQRGSIQKPSFRRDARTGPVFGGLSPPKALAARGFIDLVATEEVEGGQGMGESRGLTRLKRSVSDAKDVARRAGKMDGRDGSGRAGNWRASSVPLTGGGGCLMAMPRGDALWRGEGLGSMTGHEGVAEMFTRQSARTQMPGVGPMRIPPQQALPGVPGIGVGVGRL